MRERLAHLHNFSIYAGAALLWLTTTAMHIPDGYLGPVFSAAMFVLVLPFWAAGMRSIRVNMDARNIPLIALLAAFSFVIMMFNVPLPGGTSGHAVGAALAGIILGPAAATIALSIALIIQALFFGDGGILALGANCFNMAVVVPYVAAGLYGLLTRNASATSGRRVIGAALGGWLGLTLAALLAGVEFGLQPVLSHSPDGAPLYAPYSLGIAIPAMVLPHAAVASIIEGLLTALVIAYLQRTNLPILNAAEIRAEGRGESSRRTLRWLVIVLAVLVVASPLGLLAPGTAWGEWGRAELVQHGLGSIPAGMEQLTGLWGAPLANYQVHALGNASLGYMLSGALGVVVVGVLTWLFTSLLAPTHPARSNGH